MSEVTDAQRAAEREVSRKNEYAYRTSLLRRDLDRAQSMLRAATWEPADVRAKRTEMRALAVQEAREALDRHLAADPQQDTSWLDL